MIRSFTKLSIQTSYALRTVWQDLIKRKLGTFFTVLVISVSLTIPTVSYLLWKNAHEAATQFSLEPELTVYLHKNLAEHDINAVVERVKTYESDKIESFTYISRQQSLEEFRSWSGFGEALNILDENPLPAVVILKPKANFNNVESMTELRNGLQQIKGVQEVRLDNAWLDKLGTLTWLIARIAIICTILMVLAVFLVIGNSVRTDVAHSKAAIEVQQILGATDHFIARPFLYTGMIYGLLGGLLSILFSAVTVSYFTNIVKYVTDIFNVKFVLHSLNFSESLFLVVMCVFIGWLSAKLATARNIFSRF